MSSEERLRRTCRAIQGVAIHHDGPLTMTEWDRHRRQVHGGELRYASASAVVAALGTTWGQLLERLGVGSPRVPGPPVVDLIRDEARRRGVDLPALAEVVGEGVGMLPHAVMRCWWRWEHETDADERSVDAQLCVLGRHLSELEAAAAVAVTDHRRVA